MRPVEPTQIVLRRALPSVSLDPMTHREIQRGSLPAGTVVLDALRVLRLARSRGDATATICVHDGCGWFGVERVAVADLREAVHRARGVGPRAVMASRRTAVPSLENA